MFCRTVNEQTLLRLVGRQDGEELFTLIDSNREYLRRWHPWVDAPIAGGQVEKIIAAWQQLYRQPRHFCRDLVPGTFVRDDQPPQCGLDQPLGGFELLAGCAHQGRGS